MGLVCICSSFVQGPSPDSCLGRGCFHSSVFFIPDSEISTTFSMRYCPDARQARNCVPHIYARDSSRHCSREAILSERHAMEMLLKSDTV